MGTKTEALLASDVPIVEIEEFRALILEGQERGFLTFEQITSCLEEVEVTKEQVVELHAYLEDQGIDVVNAEDGRPAIAEGRRFESAAAAREDPRRAAQAGDRPDRRAQPRLTEALPAIDRSRSVADGRARGRARPAHRARRPGGQAGDGGGQPAPRRLHRQGLPRPRPVVPGPDPGGLARPHPRRREVRLPARLQVLDLRDLVDPPGGDAGDRGQGPHDPHPRPHGGEAQQGRARRAPARPAARP